MPTVLEFFAGIGLMRAGLEAAGFEVIWANDISMMKQQVYTSNFGADGHRVADIRDVRGRDMPEADLATVSFPCVDVSLAGNYEGVNGAQSSLFFEVMRILEEMDGRIPRMVLVENVPGLIASNSGADLRLVIAGLNGYGYGCDLLIVDAAWFVPQSRRRVFIVATQEAPADSLTSAAPRWAPASSLRPTLLSQWIRSNPDLDVRLRHLVPPIPAGIQLGDIVEDLDENDPRWWNAAEMSSFDAKVVPHHRHLLRSVSLFDEHQWISALHRSRGAPVQWELRSDQIAGCLTAARGGSNRRAVVRTGTSGHRVRWMTGREFARLQGASDDFDISMLSDDQARRCFGDAVCVPVIEWIARTVLLPEMAATTR